ncbi:MAG: RDD family protein [Planctomycetota bacterium]
MGRSREARREVYTVRALPHPALPAHRFVPRDRLGIVTPLPPGGRLVGFVGTPEGPTALLLPTGEGAFDGPSLRRLGGGEWRELPLPAIPADVRESRLAPPGPSGDGLTILAESPTALETLVYRRGVDGEWSTRRAAVGLQAVRDVVRVGDQLLLSRAVDDGQALAYLRPTQLLPLATVQPPDARWALVGLGDAPWLLSLPATAEDGRPMITRIDPISGSMAEATPLRPPPSGTATVLHQSFLLALAITITLLALVFRPGVGATVALPEGVSAMPFGTRVIATAVDLAPGALLSLLVLDATPFDLVRAPLFTPDVQDSAACTVMIGVTVLQGLVIETLTARSVGKLLAGGRVVRTDGQQASRAQLVVRNLVKLLVLMLPPLALLTLLNPHRQAVHDLFARTVVISARGGPADAPEGGDSDR